MKSIALRPWELAAYMREKKLLVVRPVKPQPVPVDQLGDEEYDGPKQYFIERGKLRTPAHYGSHEVDCPFGKPGEVLGIKEACRTGKGLDGKSFAQIAEACREANYRSPWCPVKYESDGRRENDFSLSDFGGDWGKLRPSAHMPDWLIRHRPTIADIRVMRVSEMSEQDAQATGMRSFTKDGRQHKFWFCDPVENNPPKSLRVSWADMPHTATEAFAALWHKHYPTLSWGWGIFLEGT